MSKLKQKEKMAKTIQRAYYIDPAIAAEFEAWCDANGYQRSFAVQLAVWVISRFDPVTRQRCTELMNIRAGGDDLKFVISEESATMMESLRKTIRKPVSLKTDI
jgi:hypothetical protein